MDPGSTEASVEKSYSSAEGFGGVRFLGPGGSSRTNSGGASTVTATDRIPQPVLAVRDPRADYTTATLRPEEAPAKQ